MHDLPCVCLQLECNHHLFDLCIVVASTGISMLDVQMQRTTVHDITLAICPLLLR